MLHITGDMREQRNRISLSVDFRGGRKFRVKLISDCPWTINFRFVGMQLLNLRDIRQRDGTWITIPLEFIWN